MRADIADENGCPPIDEPLGQALVQRVGQPAFDFAGPLRPFGRFLQPVCAVSDVGPAADPREPVGERLDVAGHVVQPRDLRGEPFVGHMAAFADVAEQPPHHAGVVHWADLAEIRQPAHRPQAPRLTATLRGDRRIFRDMLEHREVDRLRRRPQQGISAFRLEACDQGADVAEIEIGVAPIDGIERPEPVFLDRLDLFVGEGRAFARAEAERTEAAVFLVATGPPRDLGHFRDGQTAVAPAVKLFQAREGDMGHVHVEAHPDRVGRDEIVDLAALEHRNLGVARCGRECAHHNRRAAAKPAEHLGKRVNLLG